VKQETASSSNSAHTINQNPMVKDENMGGGMKGFPQQSNQMKPMPFA
jgi:hypothetical protein